MMFFNNQTVTLYCPCPDAETAEKIARWLVAEKLAACVTLLPEAISFYEWEGSLKREAECILLAKTTATCRPAIIEELPKHHPYTCPCILFWDNEAVNPAYATWVSKVVRRQ